MSCSVIVEPPSSTCQDLRGGPRRAGKPLGVEAPVIVEAPVFEGDYRPGQMLAEPFEADGLTALSDSELPYLLPVHVVDVEVFGELGIGPVEVALELLGDEKIKAGDDDHGAYAQDQSEVEEGA